MNYPAKDFIKKRNYPFWYQESIEGQVFFFFYGSKMFQPPSCNTSSGYNLNTAWVRMISWQDEVPNNGWRGWVSRSVTYLINKTIYLVGTKEMTHSKFDPLFIHSYRKRGGVSFLLNFNIFFFVTFIFSLILQCCKEWISSFQWDLNTYFVKDILFLFTWCASCLIRI